MRYDTVVIGAGLAGLTTACHLARAQQKVLLVAYGMGALLLAPGGIDVLGFRSAQDKEPLPNPLDGLPAFLENYPDHPYQILGRQNIEAGLTAFQALVDGSLTYQGQPDRNWLLSGGAGAVHPTCLAPTALVNGELSQRGKLLIVGFKELRDYYPALISQNLNAQELGVTADSLTIELPRVPVANQQNVTPLELAHAFETVEFRRQIVNALKNKHKGHGRIGFPAVLGLEKHDEVVADLQKAFGKPVFEISTLPPSVPGRRLFEALKRTFLQAGGKMIVGSKVVDGTIEAGQVSQIRFETASRLKAVQAGAYVLATGGIFSGGLQTEADGGLGRVWEPIFGLPIVADSNRHLWFATGFLDPKGQPFASFGMRVNAQLNPVDETNAPVAQNLYMAGASLAGSDWTLGRTGGGVALASAAAIAAQISQ